MAYKFNPFTGKLDSYGPILTGTGTVAAAASGTAALPGIAFASDLNTGIYNPAADTLGLSTNGSERARIDSSGRLLVGTSTARSNFFPSAGWFPIVQIESATNGGRGLSIVNNRTDNNGPQITFGKANGASIGSADIVLNNDTLGAISFTGADGTNLIQGARIEAAVDGTPGTNDMPGRLIFSTTADGAATPTEQLRITSDRYVRLASGTGGIQFNGDTAAANALDDYEEGTFTPAVEGTSTAGTATYTASAGRYTKVGNRVIFNLRIIYSAHTGTGDMIVTGLPFAPNSTINTMPAISIRINNLALPANSFAQGYPMPGNTYIALESMVTGGGAVAALALDTAADLMISGSYLV